MRILPLQNWLPHLPKMTSLRLPTTSWKPFSSHTSSRNDNLAHQARLNSQYEEKRWNDIFKIDSTTGARGIPGQFVGARMPSAKVSTESSTPPGSTTPTQNQPWLRFIVADSPDGSQKENTNLQCPSPAYSFSDKCSRLSEFFLQALNQNAKTDPYDASADLHQITAHSEQPLVEAQFLEDGYTDEQPISTKITLQDLHMQEINRRLQESALRMRLPFFCWILPNPILKLRPRLAFTMLNALSEVSKDFESADRFIKLYIGQASMKQSPYFLIQKPHPDLLVEELQHDPRLFDWLEQEGYLIACESDEELYDLSNDYQNYRIVPVTAEHFRTCIIKPKPFNRFLASYLKTLDITKIQAYNNSGTGTLCYVCPPMIERLV